MPATNGSIKIIDYAGVASYVNPNLHDMDAGGTTFGSISQDLDEIKDGVILLIDGVVRESKMSIAYPETGGAPTIDATRKGKWLVRYLDTTPYLGAASTVANPGFNKVFTLEIPTANRDLLDDNEDELDLDDTDVAAAIAAIEPNIRSPFNRATAQAVTPSNEIISITYVGRNL